MAIAYRSTSSGDISGAGATTTITLPANVAATDVVIVVFNSRRVAIVSPNVVTAPAGWTAIHSAITDNNGIVEATLHAFWALGNVANLTFSNSQTVTLNQGWACTAYTGADNTNPIDATAAPTSGTTPVTTNSVTVVTAGSWHCIGVCDTDTQQISTTGFANSDNWTASNAYVGLLYNTTPKPAGATGTVGIGISVSDPADVLLGMPFTLAPDVNVTVAAAGQSLAVGQGSAQASVSVAATGQALTAARGSVSPSSSIAAAGQFVQVTQGEATAPNDVAVVATGQSLTVAQGTVTPSNSVATSGITGVVAQGSVTAGPGPPLPGAAGGIIPTVTYILTGN